MNEIILKPQPLTQDNFIEFGDVIDITDKNHTVINDGFAKKYQDLASIDTSYNNGVTSIHVFVAKKREFPLAINMLEKHPHFSQAFIPSTNDKFLLVAANPTEDCKLPNLNKIKSFVTNGKQGVNYAKNVWHFPLISLIDEMRFFVIDRKDTNDKITQCTVIDIKEKILLEYDND